MIDQTPPPNPEDQKPPFFKTWARLYWFVIGNLVVLILLFYLFTKAYQ